MKALEGLSEDAKKELMAMIPKKAEESKPAEAPAAAPAAA